MADRPIADHVLTKTFTAGEELEGNRFVKRVTGGNTVVYADSGEGAIGVVRDKIAIAKLADIILVGTAFVMTSENVAADSLVSADTDGKAQATAGSEQVLGKALTDANSGEYVKVLLSIGGAA